MIKLISKVSFLCLSQDCFFFIGLSQYLMNRGITVSQISFLLMVKKISQILTEVPSAILFERFNPKVLFIISRICKIISMIMLFIFTDMFGLITASIISGLAVSSLFSKIDIYIYNSLEEAGNVNLFPRAIAMYYCITDFLMVWMYYISGVLIDNVSYNFILKISIVFVSLSFPVIFVIDDKKLRTLNLDTDINKTVQYIKVKIQKMMKELKKKELLLSIILLGFLNAFIWEIVPLTTLILKYNQKLLPFASDGNIAKISSALFLMMSIGSFISIFLKNFDIKRGLKIVFCLFLFLPFSTLNIKILLFYMLLFMILYTFCEICIERFLDNSVSKEVRASCFSLVSIVLVISQIVGYGLFSFMSKIYNPNYGIAFFFIFCTLAVSLIIFLLKKQKRTI